MAFAFLVFVTIEFKAGKGASGSLGVTEPPGTVTAERSDIANVLTLNADVVSRPEYSLTAPAIGTFMPKVSEGQVVRAGEPVGTVSSGTADRVVKAPAAGRIVKILAEQGDPATEGLPLVTIRHMGFALKAAIAPADRYRLTALQESTPGRASIDKGPGPFACPLLGGPQSEGGRDIALLCASDTKLRLFEGLTGIMAINMESRKNVLALPLKAVAGDAEYGQVNLLSEGGGVNSIKVSLGITDGTKIEIKSGLKEGDVVSLETPSLTSSE
ncbi:biotin/lipoyl-containing protein [Streptomyces sp. NPDC047967]|uniref:biotin/lipoyl-containing protein n=1 Tax=Streptomyces sp. NPDC047967 TaxID=3154924 RepID=UPI0033F11FD9